MKGSLRWRLFAIYVLLASIILFSAGFLVYIQVQNRLIYNRWSQTDELVSWALTHTEPQTSLRADDINEVAKKLASSPGPDFSFFLLDINGNLIESLGLGNPDFVPVLLSSEEISNISLTDKAFNIVTQPAGYDHRILTTIWPVYNSRGSFIGAIQSEVRLDEADNTLSQLRWILIIGFFLLLVITSSLWFIMTRAITRPLINMANISKSVSAGSYDQRIPVPRTKDETYYTITTFNKMLDNVQANISREKDLQIKIRQFMADSSHELRSPLTVMKGFVDVLQRGAKDDPQSLQQALEAMRLSLDKMSHLINDMLKLSQLEAVTAVNMEVIELNSLCRSTIDAARVLAKDKLLEFDAGPIVKIKGDERLLEQALWNLVENSIRHTATDGKINVTISCRTGWVRLTVEDNGEGIPAEHLGKIFERFYRIGKKNPQGTGLGLSITKSIVELHGGKIAVRSILGSGTVFTLDFPLAN
jgi:two-component system, OmpR family, sensor kinase